MRRKGNKSARGFEAVSDLGAGANVFAVVVKTFAGVAELFRAVEELFGAISRSFEALVRILAAVALPTGRFADRYKTTLIDRFRTMPERRGQAR